MTGFERVEYDAAILRLGESLDAAALGSAWTEGRQMATDEAVAFAGSE